MSAIEISEMIDLLENHFSPKWGSEQVMVVGGIAGTAIFKHAIHACMKSYDFQHILVVDGCQDYIGLLRKPVHNYIYYMDMFMSEPIPSLEEKMRPFHKFPMEMLGGYRYHIQENLIYQYKAMIINNAHLIPDEFLSAIHKYFPGVILEIVDPLDLNGIDFHNIPTLYDSLTKQSPLIAMARSMFGIESRAIDRKVRGDFKQVKMSRRSIGKLDANQYVTNSPMILKQIQDKQIQSQFRRNQKFIVDSDEIRIVSDQNNCLATIGPKTMLSIMTVSKPLMKLRIHSSAREFYSTLSYRNTQKSMYVKPANILSIDDAIFHRFQSLVVVLGEEPMTNRVWYSLLKIANTITIVNY